MGTYKYKAFISYSHKDERWGRWLHRRLETYKTPKHLVGRKTGICVVPKRLKPIFRDREELAAAGNLGDKIEQALAESECLIVICSPRAARSHWVNQEILHFKRTNHEARVFCVIVDGEPFASDKPGGAHAECFPEALRFQLGADGGLSNEPAEPLAADMRAQGDGKRGGLLKLVSGLVGVGLDELVRRDTQRRMHSVMAVTASAFIGMLVMVGMTMIAIKSRNEAQHQRAEAEGLVAFMLTDLRSQIRGSVGELSVTSAVNKRMMDYYSAQGDLSKLPADSLELRAQIIGAMGQDAEVRGNFTLAKQKYKQVHQITAALLEADPKNPDRLLAHAKSGNRLGLLAHSIGQFTQALPYLQNAIALLDKIPPGKRHKGEWAQLAGYVHANSCAALLKAKLDGEKALKHCQLSVLYSKQLIAERPEDLSALYDLVFHTLWLSDAWQAHGDETRAEASRLSYLNLSEELVAKEPANIFWRDQQKQVYKHFARALLSRAKADEARQYYQKALAISTDLIATDPTNDDWLQHHKQLKKILDNLESGNPKKGQ